MFQSLSVSIGSFRPNPRLLSVSFVLIFSLLGLFSSRAEPTRAAHGLAPAADSPAPGPESEVWPESASAGLAVSVLPFGVSARRELKPLSIYIVEPNDNVTLIAEKFGLAPETIVAANPELRDDPDMLLIDQQLLVPPVDGVLHTVAPGETIDSIAKQYKVTASIILDLGWNELGADSVLNPGDMVIIPGVIQPMAQPLVRVAARPMAFTPAPKGAPVGRGRFVWPTRGAITQGFWSGHGGIDIGANTGEPVVAADTGYVTFAGMDSTGYGRMLLIDHSNGYTTLYGHLSSIAVSAGKSVKQGQLIGRVGSSGHSTGPHLDFRIRQGGSWLSPFNFLP